jgi:hypothetical protein
MSSPPITIMKKLISKYNKDLKISGHSKMKASDKDKLIALVKQKKYTFVKSGDQWDLIPNAEMKRQTRYAYNTKTKNTTMETYKKKK